MAEENAPTPLPLPFPANSAAYRNAIESHVRAGCMSPDNARRIIEGLDQLPPEKSPVEKRMEELERLLVSPVIGEHAGNAAAVLEGYKSGNLEYVAGHYYIFRNGKKEAGPRPLSAFDPEKVLWGEYPSPRGVWIESCTGPQYLMPAFSQTVYPDESGHHNPTIHPDDLQGLELPLDYTGWSYPKAYETANGPVERPTIWLEAAFCDVLSSDFSSVTSYKRFLFAISPNFCRLGGPILRSHICQGTLPDGQSRIATATTRTGLSGLLREHANN